MSQKMTEKEWFELLKERQPDMYDFITEMWLKMGRVGIGKVEKNG